MQCPSCATPVDVDQRHAHLVVCSSCHSAFVLDGEAASIHGEMAVLAQPAGPLAVGSSGVLQGRAFTVLGRVRYGYDKGYWDEWFLADESGETFWIGEDEREFTASTLQELDGSPAWDDFEPGTTVSIGDRSYHVDERDVARCEGGEGQLPFVVTVGEEVPFVDLTRVGGFATLEWSDGKARLFAGRHLPVRALRMDYASEDTGALDAERAAGVGGRRRVIKKGGREVALNCESCGAPPVERPPEGADSIHCEFCGHQIDLSLERVPCGSCGAGMALHSVEAAAMSCAVCGSQHEVAGDRVRLIAQLTQERPRRPIRIGLEGRFRGRTWRIVGHVRSYELDEGKKYHSDAFCAFEEEQGYAWFEIENGHASFNQATTSRPMGFDPRRASRKQKFTVNGTSWTVFERGRLTVEYVGGELPWVAAVGDVTGYMDAIAPPYMLCAEWSDTEVEWSRSEWIAPAEFCAAFGLKPGAVHGRGVAPHQPYPHTESDRGLLRVGALVVALNLAFIIWSYAAGSGVEIGRIALEPAEYAEEFLTRDFTVTEAPTLCRATFDAPVDNSWVYLDCALVDEQERAVLEFSAECSYYHGYEGGEKWSEGSRTDHIDFKVEEPGTYRLLVKGSAGIGNAEGGWAGPTVSVVVKEGIRQARYAGGVLALGALLLIVVVIRRAMFSGSRWNDE